MLTGSGRSKMSLTYKKKLSLFHDIGDVLCYYDCASTALKTRLIINNTCIIYTNK